MPTYQPISDAEIDPDSPLTHELMTKIRDNILTMVSRTIPLNLITLSSGQWVVPDGVLRIYFCASGGTGGQGGGDSYYQGALGGDGGISYGQSVDVTPGEVLTVEIGLGGGGGSGPGPTPLQGGTGGTTYLKRGGTVLASAPGGIGGLPYWGSGGPPEKGAPGASAIDELFRFFWYGASPSSGNLPGVTVGAAFQGGPGVPGYAKVRY